VFDHERIYTELYCFTRPAAGGVVAEGLGAIENALLDAKAKALGVPCHALLGGKLRDRIRVSWSHCATWRINHPTLYKPAITSLDGVKAIGAEVREKLRRAEDEHLHLQWGRSARLAPRVWRSVHARAQC
jgi:L-alanine-DL-glutamate epimerase-like enolase superfamily enzyme